MHPFSRDSAKRAAERVRLGPRAVRIIGGQWRKTPLSVAEIDGLRPTPDRVRESVFNWLVHLRGGNLDGVSVLDLFAGTGALGFEAASRGARAVLLVEMQARAILSLEAAKEKLSARQIEILRADALSTAQRLVKSGERFDVIFLDPPFRQGWLERIVGAARDLLSPDGLLYVESETRVDDDSAARWGLDVVRADKAGQVFYHLLRRKTGDTPRENTPC